jgi:hypothetical protein
MRAGTMLAVALPLGVLVFALSAWLGYQTGMTARSPSAVQDVTAVSALVLTALCAFASLEQIIVLEKLAVERERMDFQVAEFRIGIERQKFTRDILARPSVYEPTHAFRLFFDRFDSDITYLRSDIRERVRRHPEIAQEIVRRGFDALAEIAELHRTSAVDHDVLYLHVAKISNIAAYCYGPLFSEIGAHEWRKWRDIKRFLADSRCWLRQNEPWIEGAVPDFYAEIEARFGDRRRLAG